MESLPREQLITNMQNSFQTYINQYGVDHIGIFEEEGQDDYYYLGYTVKKAGKTYHIHSPYRKDSHGDLSPIVNEWTIESDEPQKQDLKGYHSLDSALRDI
ncbi:DUF5634 family protein [Cytobacillus praedii]|uniref:GK1464-like domain-containing protein n=1 Tax=Cytobacillus praedii TaxID=1742358 RepID=A0A4V2NU36_9BACI|nr:DUF5634 family protein [Cytobacillus praedii]MED3553167.1 DUF5634 family protein [Cytobacillus praedii]TCJ02768.1 hypothetical protein E0Y62_17890 [Cytobacillus praedii]